jgi:hypothetical protein
MKDIVAYVIWNKVKMLDWIADGILESFSPERVDILFVLDNPTDGTEVKLEAIIKEKLSNFKTAVKIFDTETYKFPCQNFAMDTALIMGYRSVICPQDDQKITDPDLLKNIDKLFGEYEEKLGVVGLRDGFDFGYGNMVSSAWSESVLSKVLRLVPGEYREVQLINDGPIIYPTKVINKIGYNDVTTFRRFYIEDDYALRANQNGFKNIVLGKNLIHKKENASKSSTHYDNNDGALDMAAFKNKWGI